MTPNAPADKVRLDKWLWAARFYKTRSLASEAIDKGRVRLNGQPTKPARELKPGDTLELRNGPALRTVTVKALSNARGPAPVAALLYEETPESLAQRLAAADLRRLAMEGRFTRATMVWSQGQDGWKMAAETELAALLDSLPPPPPKP